MLKIYLILVTFMVTIGMANAQTRCDIREFKDVSIINNRQAMVLQYFALNTSRLEEILSQRSGEQMSLVDLAGNTFGLSKNAASLRRFLTENESVRSALSQLSTSTDAFAMSLSARGERAFTRCLEERNEIVVGVDGEGLTPRSLPIRVRVSPLMLSALSQPVISLFDENNRRLGEPYPISIVSNEAFARVPRDCRFDQVVDIKLGDGSQGSAPVRVRSVQIPRQEPEIIVERSSITRTTGASKVCRFSRGDQPQGYDIFNLCSISASEGVPEAERDIARNPRIRVIHNPPSIVMTQLEFDRSVNPSEGGSGTFGGMRPPITQLREGEQPSLGLGLRVDFPSHRTGLTARFRIDYQVAYEVEDVTLRIEPPATCR
jgi:hypothetical protein